MICPYCDSLLKETPESGTCPNCGGPVGAPLRKKWGAAQKQKDLEYYYQRYKHDKIQAIVALRVDTGLDAVTAKQEIDKVFARHALSRQNDSRTEDIIHCPKCLSTEIEITLAASKPDTYTGFYNTPSIRLIASGIKLVQLINYTANKGRMRYRCNKCSYEWKS